MRPLRSPLWLILLATAAIAAPANSAEPPNAPTALERAYRLDAGKDMPRDAAAAALAYAEAAASGDAFAHLRLGYLYETGDGVPQDYGIARQHYQVAADAGLKEAHLHLALCNLEGWGGPADRAAFIRELKIAAEADHIPAQRILASAYMAGIGVPVDRAESTKWLERAAKLDDAEAQLSLGQEAEKNRRMALMPDHSLPRTWYQLSAEQDYTAAMRAMARTFLRGSAKDRDWVLGHRWLEMAVDGGDDEAPYILAVYELLHVDSPRRDEVKARAWMQMASERGNWRATEVLQWEADGRTLADAIRYVLTTPSPDRSRERLAIHTQTGPNRQPQAYRKVAPKYPKTLRLAETTGKTIVDFIVDTNGRVQNAYAVSSTHPLFSEPAVEAVRQWRFYPGYKDGKPVSTHLQVPIFFDLRDEQLDDIDTFLAFVRGRAHKLGPSAEADAVDARIIHPKKSIKRPKLADGSRWPADVGVVLLIVVDGNGHPLRGHVLFTDPASAGPVLLAAALAAEFNPRIVDGQPVETHGIFTYATGKFRHTELMLK